MSRVNLTMIWVILLLVPAVAVAQRNNDRSRSRTESRQSETDRSVDRSKAVAKKSPQKGNDRPRLKEDKVSRSTSGRVQSRNRRAERQRQSARQDRNRKLSRNDSGSRTSARKSRSPRVKNKPVERNEVRNKPSRKRVVTRKPTKGKAVTREPARREVARHKPVRHDVRHKSVNHKRGTVAKRRHHASKWKKNHVRHSHERYAYKHRRYHRHRGHGVSTGFYIRIPSVRWHVGHTRRFAYRQIVSGHPAGDLEVVSTFKRKIRGVHREYVDVEFELDRIEVLSRGFYLGDVDRFPRDLRRMRAKIYRDGFVQFDRMLYIVGNEHTGFELLSTRYCGGDLTRAAFECLDARAGAVDFYDERVHGTRYSDLLDLALTGHAVPVALIPDEEYLGFQYVVGYGASSDGYYTGAFDYSSLSRYDADGTAYRISAGAVGGFEEARGRWTTSGSDLSGFFHKSAVPYSGGNGTTLQLQIQTEIVHVD